MKTCQFPGCRYPVFGKGFCKFHQYKREDYDRRTPMQKHFDKVKKEGNAIVAIDELPEQEKWYKKVAKEIAKNPYCQECGTFIPDRYFDLKADKYVLTDRFYRAASAHILAKALFPSVKIHPLNKIIAGSGCGCHNKTHRWDTFQKMNVWPLALERIEMMFPELSQEEIRRLPEEILTHINNKQPF